MTALEARIDYPQFTAMAPAAYAGLSALGKAVDTSGLDKGLVELVKIRASQLNGCAFCTQFHLTLARRNHVAPEKIDLVAVWHDAGVFTPREMAALAWTESLTDLAGHPVPDAAWQAIRAEFSEEETAFLTVAIATINAWNRIGAALRFVPQIPRTSG